VRMSCLRYARTEDIGLKSVVKVEKRYMVFSVFQYSMNPIFCCCLFEQCRERHNLDSLFLNLGNHLLEGFDRNRVRVADADRVA